jgi:aminopeptidase N
MGKSLIAFVFLSVANLGPSLGFAGGADPRIDDETGRQTAVWSPGRHFDHRHMRLEIDIPTMNEPKLTAVETLTVAAVGRERGLLVLDCRGPVVESVAVEGKKADFESGDGKLRVRFERPVPAGRTVTLTIRYSLDFGANRGNGLTWTAGKGDAPSLTRQAAQIHAQGQAQLNSLWFACHDFPNDRLTTELIVTVEDGYDVVSNGHLVEKKSIGKGRTRWHWVQDKEHVYYLVTLAIGKFAIRDVGGPDSARPGLAMPVYVPHGREENIENVFGATPAMVAFFERVFDEAYPWDKYAQVCVRAFAAGGMENTSCTLLTEGTAGATGAGSQDALISHELAHQWFGDLFTCKSWAHLWLNEGWASYAECLWAEEKAGADPEARRQAYHRAVLQYVRSQRMRNRASAPESVPIVSNRYENPDAVFMKTDDPYAKGAVILHMLRERLGDETFFRGVRGYVDRYKFGLVETDDFRRVMERVSGQSLERFFDQWCMRPGMARLAVELEWDDAAKVLGVSVEQTQTIDRLNPAYSLTLPLRVRFEDGSEQWLDLHVDSRLTKGRFTLPGKPRQVSVDPNLTCFAANTVRKPLAWWIDEALHGATLASRLDAVEALGKMDEPLARAVLAELGDSTEPMIRDAARGGRHAGVFGDPVGVNTP